MQAFSELKKYLRMQHYRIGPFVISILLLLGMSCLVSTLQKSGAYAAVSVVLCLYPFLMASVLYFALYGKHSSHTETGLPHKIAGRLGIELAKTAVFAAGFAITQSVTSSNMAPEHFGALYRYLVIAFLVFYIESLIWYWRTDKSMTSTEP